MKALTIWPEWCWAIVHLGKNVENRRWDPRRRGLQIGDRFAIHAGKTIGGRPGIEVRRKAFDDLRFMAERAGYLLPMVGEFAKDGEGFVVPMEGGDLVCDGSTVVRSAIVAVATLADVTRESWSPWAAPGEVHWVLGPTDILPEPVVCGGKQGLWTLPPEVQIRVDQQMNALDNTAPEPF